MNRIDQTFLRLKDKKRSALIPFVVAGDLDLGRTKDLVLRMAECGADIIELGVPFSDPLADGPTIQNAYQRALRNGTHLKEVFLLSESLKGISTPLILMTYFNPVFRYGLKGFAEKCIASGIDGVIIPDLPPEEANPWIDEARRVNLDTIFLTTPTSPTERIKLVKRCSRGFIYYVSITGVTGVRKEFPEDLERSVMRVKELTQKPVAVGFGVSTPEHVRIISHYADGIIVGSAIVKIIEKNLDHPDLITKVGDFISSLSSALGLSAPLPT